MPGLRRLSVMGGLGGFLGGLSGGCAGESMVPAWLLFGICAGFA